MHIKSPYNCIYQTFLELQVNGSCLDVGVL